MSVQSPEYIAFSPRRVGAIVLRHWYVIKSSWPRIFDLMYWPMVQMLMWGFLQLYVAQHSNFFAQAAGTFIAAVILWDILFRGQLGFSISFLEELYSRNMGNLMMSPLRPSRIRCRVDDHEHHPAGDRYDPGHVARDRVLRLQSVGAWGSRSPCSSSTCS